MDTTRATPDLKGLNLLLAACNLKQVLLGVHMQQTSCSPRQNEKSTRDTTRKCPWHGNPMVRRTFWHRAQLSKFPCLMIDIDVAQPAVLRLWSLRIYSLGLQAHHGYVIAQAIILSETARWEGYFLKYSGLMTFVLGLENWWSWFTWNLVFVGCDCNGSDSIWSFVVTYRLGLDDGVLIWFPSLGIWL